MTPLIPVIIAFVFSISYYLFSSAADKFKRYDPLFISFSSGFFLSYLFLTMIPTTIKSTPMFDKTPFFLILLGFLIFHLLERVSVDTIQTNYAIEKKLIKIRHIGFSILHFFFGFIFVFLFKPISIIAFSLSIIPIFFYLLSSAMISEHLHRKIRETRKERFFSSGVFLYGTLIATLLRIPEPVFLGIFTIITGSILYILVRDILPQYKEGKPFYLILGVIFYIILLSIPSYLF